MDDMRLLLLACALCGCLFAQPAATPRFEAASIRPTPPPPEGGVRPGRFTQDSSGIDYFSTGVYGLIMRAWKLQDYELALPNGLSQKWNIVARSPEGATADQIPLMLQDLLIDRFGLKFHRESRNIAAYVLVPAKNGPRLKEAETAGGAIGFGRAPRGGLMRMKGNATLDTMGYGISDLMSQPVINQTGLAGVYEISVDYEPGSSTPETASNLQHAIEDTLGLKLESRKVPVNVFVVDHIEKTPTEN